MYANEFAPAISRPEAWPGDGGGGGGGSTMGGADCSLMVYGAASRREDGVVVAVLEPVKTLVLMYNTSVFRP